MWLHRWLTCWPNLLPRRHRPHNTISDIVKLVTLNTLKKCRISHYECQLIHRAWKGSNKNLALNPPVSYISQTMSQYILMWSDTWLHVLLTCKQQHIHSLHVKRHNKAVWEIRKLLISSEKSRCYILMNVGSFNNAPQENTVPNWLLPCTCGTQRCHFNSRFRPDILCVKGLPYQNDPPQT